MNKILEQLKVFHGHVGPYALIGYKMGEIANHQLGTNPFDKRAIVWTGTTPPMSCIIDGIQMSSGCTLGKGNIIVHDKGVPKARFVNNTGKQIEIMLKPAVQKEIDTTVTEENITEFTEKLFKKSNNKLFDIRK